MENKGQRTKVYSFSLSSENVKSRSTSSDRFGIILFLVSIVESMNVLGEP